MGSSIFEREIGKMLHTMYPLVIHPIDVRGTRFTFPKVADYLACDPNGFFVLVEVKQTRGNSFPFSRIRCHQRGALTRINATQHGQSYFALNFRSPKINLAYWIPWQIWLQFEERWHKKSVRQEELIEHFAEYKLVRITKGWKFSEQYRFRCDSRGE